MNILRRQIALIIFKLLDLALMSSGFIVGALVLAYEIDSISFSSFLSMRIKLGNLAIFLAFLLVWHLIFCFFRLYSSKRFSTRWDEGKDIIKATFVGTLAIAVVGAIFRIKMITPVFLGSFWLTVATVTILSRILIRKFLGIIRVKGRNLRSLLIVGTNPRALRLARKIDSQPQMGYHIVGFVDDEWSGTDLFKETGYPLVADFKNFSEFIKDHVVDEVMVVLPIKSFYDQTSKIIAACTEQGILLRFFPGFFNLKLGHFRGEQFDEYEVVTFYTGAMNGLGTLIKRLIDFSHSLILILLLSPLFLAIAILIKITSPGPILFIQERVGLNKRKFRLYKFRTMIPDAEKKMAELEHLNEMQGPVFKIKDDPRITPIGRFLRKTSLDELPQLINVLKGDMSMVGPRPLPLRDYNGFKQDWQRRRFSVLPGITCLWQINGRNLLPFEKWMELDMEYIDQWSLWLDLKIFVTTVFMVFRGSGAT